MTSALDQLIAHDATALQRAAFEMLDVAATEGADGVRRIKGTANTFGVMRSGRIILPSAANDWLAANPEGRVQFMARHGMGVLGFATIGKATLRATAKGLLFEAVLARGTALAEEAWTLAQQGMLSAVSLGWYSKQARYVTENDKDLDPHLAKEMKRSKVREAVAYIDIEPVEVSLVDVPDDAGAKLAADAEVAALAEAVSAAVVAKLGPSATLGGSALDTVVTRVTAALETKLRDLVLHDVAELLDGFALDPEARYGAALLDADTDHAPRSCAAHAPAAAGQPRASAAAAACSALLQA